MIVIIDYNMGNIHSVKKAFKRIGCNAIISNDKEMLLNADKIVLPGVGHFKHGMEQLHNLDLIKELNQQVLKNKKPILGICLGMQLFTKISSEGNSEGLGWVKGETCKFEKKNMKNGMKIPHMGWNNVHFKDDSNLFNQISFDDMFYFVHSYYVKTENSEVEIGKTNYGESFTSVIQKENIFGVQFHPEKSHDAGLNLLKNFIELS